MKYIISFSTLLLVFITVTAQNVGIGTTTPLEKLSILTGFGHGISHDAGGIKISTYIDANGGWIGTVTNNPFHLYTNNGGAQFSLLQNGNVGIGNINPQFKLDINGRMKIQTGAIGNIFTTPGIWFDDFRNGSNRVFFGMQDSIRIGIWGEGTPGAGWAFNFNARNGNVGIGVSDPVNKLEVNGDISAINFKFSNPKTYYYSIPPAAFVSETIHTDFITAYITESPNNSSTYKLGGYSTDGFVAPVQLPDGATITSISFYIIDNSSTENLTCVLRRRLHGGDIYLNLSSMATVGTPGLITLTTSSIGFPVIDNQNFNYTISIGPELTTNWANAELQIKSVRISYTLLGF